MKFCPKCGAQLDDSVKFCGVCGSAVETPAQPVGAVPNGMPMQNNGMPMQNNGMPMQQGNIPNYQQNAVPGYQQQGGMAGAAAAPKPNPFSNLLQKLKANPKIPIIAGAAVVLIVAAIIIIANVTKYQRIDAKELFKFEFEGLDSYGTVSGKLNCYDDYVYSSSDAMGVLSDALEEYDLDDLEDLDDLDDDIGKETVSPYFSLNEDTFMDAWSKADDESEAKIMRNALLRKNKKTDTYILKCKYSKDKDLKNGDKIKVTVVYDEDYLKENKIKLKNTEFEIKVKGLEEGTKIDLFDPEYIKVTFSGTDGRGEPSVDTYGALGCISYDYDYSFDLKLGDKFKVTAKYSYGDLKKAGKQYWFKYEDKYYIMDSEEQTKEYEVTGLTELKELDPFEGLKFEYDRGTPFLRVSRVDTSGCSDIIKDYVNFYVEGADALNVNGKFTVKAYGSYSLEESGYKLKGTPDADGYITKEFTVDDSYPAYVTASNGEAAMDFMKVSVDDKITDLRKDIKGSKYIGGMVLDGKAESITSFEKVDTYVAFNSKTNYDSFSWSDYVNRVYNLYKIDVSTDGDKGKDSFYAIIYSENVIASGSEFTGSNLGYDYFATLDDFKKEILDAEGYKVTKCGGGDTASRQEKPDDSSKVETTAPAVTTAPDEKASDDSKAETTAKADTTTKAATAETEQVP